MASLQSILPGGFDAEAVEPQQNFDGEPLPAGVYEVEITNSELKDAKSGNGTGLKLEYTVIGPSHAKRKIFSYLNLRHTNSQAEQIGQSQLSALCRAVGISKLQDSDELFGRILRVSVKIRAAANGYAASNDVTGYEAVGTQAPPVRQPASAPQAQHQAPKAGASVPPWKRAA